MKRITALVVTSLAALAAMVTTSVFAVSIGDKAPEFSLPDSNGRTINLSDYRGKYVVLEWVNPGCPFVQKHYDSGNMQRLQKALDGTDVAWLTINSTNPKHRDFKTAQQMQDWLNNKSAAPDAMLMDSEGAIGQLYGAKTTPHMFVIDPKGTLIYAGAIDDKRSADQSDIKTATNYVQAALTEARAGKPVTHPTTAAYGCSVKYGT